MSTELKEEPLVLVYSVVYTDFVYMYVVLTDYMVFVCMFEYARLPGCIMPGSKEELGEYVAYGGVYIHGLELQVGIVWL